MMKATFHDRRLRTAFSVMELLFVLSLIAILAALVLPDSNPAITTRLTSAAQALESDLAYCQSLAMTHNSTYRIQFDLGTDEYHLEHTGSDTAFDALVATAIDGEPVSTRHSVRFGDRPHIGPDVVFDSVVAISGPVPSVDDVEFGSLGETTRPEETAIWLSAGEGSGKLYLAVLVDSTTGLTRIGSVSTSVALVTIPVVE